MATRTQRLAQVVPFLPRRREGVGSYALTLAWGLRTTGLETEFFAPEPAHEEAGGFASHRLEPTGLRGHILLHYSNYGYDPNGCPSELVRSLVAARRSGRISTLTAFFHEVYATSQPWRRAFWFSRRQRSLAGALARGADHVLTSIDLYAELLGDLGAREPVQVMAIPSTVGEPEIVPAVNAREPKLVVFGGAGNRAQLYRRFPQRLKAGLRQAGIQRIVDIGPQPGVAPQRIGGAEVVRLGPLADEEVSRELLGARLGALAYPPEFFGKSTVFAAFAAHGVPCLAIAPPRLAGPTPPHLELGEDLAGKRLQETARAAFEWYRPHAVIQHARLIARCFEGSR